MVEIVTWVKSGRTINVSVSAKIKKNIVCVSAKKIIFAILLHVYPKMVKIQEGLLVIQLLCATKLYRNCSNKNYSNTKYFSKNCYILQTAKKFYILLVLLNLITTVLLIAFSIYCYLIKHWAKQKYLLRCHCTINKLKEIGYWKFTIEMENNDNLKEIDTENCTCYYFYDIIKIEDFYIDNSLIDQKLCKNILVYDISYKTLMGAKHFRIYYLRSYNYYIFGWNRRIFQSFWWNEIFSIIWSWKILFNLQQV